MITTAELRDECAQYVDEMSRTKDVERLALLRVLLDSASEDLAILSRLEPTG